MRFRLAATAILALGLYGLAAAWSETESHASPGAAKAIYSPDGSDAPQAVPAAARAAAERPLPAFSGRTLEGRSVSISEFIGKRLVLYFFNPEVEESKIAGPAVAAVAREATRYNFQVVGIAMGSTADKARAYAKKQGLTFPILDDSNAAISQRFGLRQPTLLLGADAEGYFAWSVGYINPKVPDPTAVVEDQIREALRLPAAGEAEAELVRPPLAPLFQTRRMEGGSFDLAEMRGKPMVLIFFLHTCPHCHAALEFLKDQLAKIAEDERPLLVGVSLRNAPSEVRRSLAEDGLDFFEVLVDPDQSVQNAYGIFGGVPVLLYVDAEGRIVHRTEGWNEDRDPALGRMYLTRIAGVKVPMLLSRQGYTGNDVCGVCHEAEYATWQFTTHATAFDTLVTHGSDDDGECVSCHSVGFGKPGGFDLESRATHLENVGCESCHGRGGGHLPESEKITDYEAQACKTCHDAKHSLGFDYATFHPTISHVQIAALTNEQREKRVAGRSKPRNPLPTTAAIVGSDACKGCHAAEYATWASSPHGRSLASLAKEGKAEDPSCLACHTTAYGRPGGFLTGGDGPGDLARVGCESCHGPGGDHVGDSTTKLGTIVSLGDKCDSCVILQICGACHDEANDADFQFEVEERIEKQRHGTIEPGTGKPLEGDDRSALHDDLPTDLARVLALAARGR